MRGSREINNKTTEETNNEDYIEEVLAAQRKQTYSMTELQIEAIRQYSFYSRMDKEDIVQMAVNNFISHEYMEKAKDFC